MGFPFLLSYVVLGAIFAIESLAVYSVLRRSARVRLEQSLKQSRDLTVATIRVTRVPTFQGRLLDSNGFVTNSEISGKAIALLFASIEDVANEGISEVYPLLLRAYPRRSLYIFLGDLDTVSPRKLSHLHSLTRRFPSSALVVDDGYAISRQFGIDQIPMMLLVSAKGEIERVWTTRNALR